MQLLTIADLQRPQEQIAPLIQEAQNIGNMYFEFIKQDDETHTYQVYDGSEKEREIGFHASELSGCFRRLVYSISGTEKQTTQGQDVNMKMRFRIGTAVHAMVQSDMHRMAAKSNGYLHFRDEVRVHPELQELAKLWDIYSSMDGIFTICRWYPEYGQWYSLIRMGLEIKTQSDKDFENTKQPKEDHRDQTTVYMKCLDLPLMWTLYYNKSNSLITTPYAPWLFQFDSARWDKLTQRMSSATEHKIKKLLPDKEEGKPCGWCPYAWHCQPDILRKKQYHRGPLVAPGMLRR